MKLNRIKRRTGSSLVLELTPLIDVVFLLLIFFLVATSFEDIDNSIKIELPTSTVKNLNTVKEIQVIISRDKEYYINYKENGKNKTEKINSKDLKKILSEALKESENKNIIISADKSISHGEIVNVMTIAKEAGAISLDIDTASPSGK